MASKPRKTSEFGIQGGSVRKSTNAAQSSNRTSRIAVRRPSFNDRPSTSNNVPSGKFGTTPLRTPRTPSYRHSSSDRNGVPMTAEKEKPPIEDKIWLQNKTTRILDELVNVEGLTNDFIQKRNLKLMSIKQFILIMIHFLKPLVGNIKLDTSNYVDQIYEILQNMEYPYTINKSWLKTPNAPHCQMNIIVLLGWLSDFTLVDFSLDYEMDDVFPNREVASMFHSKATDAFDKWNNGQENEFEEIKNDILKAFLLERAGIVDIQADIEKIKKGYEKLLELRSPVNLEKEYHDLLEQSQQLKKKIEKQNEVCNKVKKSKEFAYSELNEKIALNQNYLVEMSDLKMQISQQILSLEQKNDILQELGKLRDMLEIKKKAITELNEDSTKNDIQLSRLLKQKFTLIEELKNNVYKLYSDMNQVGLAANLCDGKFNPSFFELRSDNQSEISEHLTELQNMAQQLNLDLMEISEQLKAENDHLVKQQTSLISEKTVVVSKTEGLEEQMHKVQDERENFVHSNEDKLVSLNRNIQLVNQNVVEIEQEIELKRKQIKSLKEQSEKRRKENVEFADNAAEKCRNAVKEKRERFFEMKSMLQEAKQILNEMELREENNKKKKNNRE